MGDLIDQPALENRMGVDVVRRILDDDNDGTVDQGPLESLIEDVEARVKASVRRGYTVQNYLIVIAQKPRLLVMMALDLAEAYAWQRWPSYCRKDGSTMLESAMKELDRVATGKLRFDITEATPIPANEGGGVSSGNPLSPIPPPRMFSDGMGDW